MKRKDVQNLNKQLLKWTKSFASILEAEKVKAIAHSNLGPERVYALRIVNEIKYLQANVTTMGRWLRGESDERL